MNIGLFLNRDIYSSYALNLLVVGLGGHRVFVFVSDKVGRAPSLEALDVLKLIEQDVPFDHVFPFVDEPGELLTPQLIEHRHGIPVESLNTPNDPETLEHLRELELDVAVSLRYGRIFKAAFVELPRLGVLNLHSGILPDYRGVMASFHALATDASEVGCTLHFIEDASIDTGPIVAEWRRPVDRSLSYFGHVLSLYDPGVRLVLDALARIDEGGELEKKFQRADEGAYFTFPQEEDIARFEARGYRLFHPSEYRELLARYHGS